MGDPPERLESGARGGGHIPSGRPEQTVVDSAAYAVGRVAAERYVRTRVGDHVAVAAVGWERPAAAPAQSPRSAICRCRQRRRLEDLPGVRSSTTNVRRRRCTVEYDSALTPWAKIVETIEGLGYRVTNKG
jgi:hypothetical protein